MNEQKQMLFLLHNDLANNNNRKMKQTNKQMNNKNTWLKADVFVSSPTFSSIVRDECLKLSICS